MKLDTKALLNHIHISHLHSIYLILGYDYIIVSEIREFIRFYAKKGGYCSSSLFILDNFSYFNTFEKYMRNYFLFEEKRIIEIIIPSGNTGKIVKRKIYWIKNNIHLIKNILFLICFCRRDQKDKLFKNMYKIGIIIKMPKINCSKLLKFVKFKLKQQKQFSNIETIEWMLNKLENNIYNVQQAILNIKMLYYKKYITLNDIKSIVECSNTDQKYNIYDLINAMLVGYSKTTIKMLSSLTSEKEVFSKTIYYILEEILLLFLVYCYKSHKYILLNRLNIFGKHKKLIMHAVNLLSIKTLNYSLHSAQELDNLNKCCLYDEFNELTKLVICISNRQYPIIQNIFF